MNSRQLHYAVVLSQNLNISQAADKLKISQPALSKQISGLEKELGVILFDRDSTPLKLTPAGECFINEAKEILLKEENLKQSMEDFKTGEKSRITVGISPFRATYFLSDVIQKLQEKYKGLQIVLRETKSYNLQKEVIEGLIDFAIINLPVDTALLDVIPLKPEPLVLVVPEKFSDLILEKDNSNSKELSYISLNKCGDIPFIALSKTQELRKLFDKLCFTENFNANILTEVVSITTAWNLAISGIGATVLPYKFVMAEKGKTSVLVYRIKNDASMRSPAIVTSKNRHISKYSKEAIELIKEK